MIDLCRSQNNSVSEFEAWSFASQRGSVSGYSGIKFIDGEPTQEALNHMQGSAALFRQDFDPGDATDPGTIYARDLCMRCGFTIECIDKDVAVERIAAHGLERFRSVSMPLTIAR